MGGVCPSLPFSPAVLAVLASLQLQFASCGVMGVPALRTGAFVWVCELITLSVSLRSVFPISGSIVLCIVRFAGLPCDLPGHFQADHPERHWGPR